ncbi:resistance to glucose repression protein 1 [[Candida] anglica]|uniref:Resistance to glucose repression protein 1 n=1 Tax=[Candida] anglica TaxID=148631 RepID=A0ABP0ECL4_9ASCO
MSGTQVSGEVFTGGATTSQHVEAEDEDHFENTTFKLKRTRSMGLLDEFIQPTTPANESQPSTAPPSVGPDFEHVEDQHMEPLPKNLTLDTSEVPEQPVRTHTPTSPILLKSPEMIPHDDTDIQEEPSRHVDYLSHKWDVSDISKSWRYVIQKRRDVADSARLENASWRTWAQRRSNLKTISPEAVNWSKESDVTWLYGPILKDEENVVHSDADDISQHKLSTTATSSVAGDISLPIKTRSAKNGPKPILKRRTVEDMMISHSNLLKLQLAENRLIQHKKQEEQKQQRKQEERHHQRKLSDNEPPEFDDYDAISAKLNSQYTTSRNSSTTSLKNLKNETKELGNSMGGVTLTSPNNAVDVTSAKGDETKEATNSNSDPTSIATTDMEQSDSVSSAESKKDRHIHFNDEVQQCIAVYEFSDEDDDEDYYDDDSDDYAYDDREDYIYEDHDNEGRTEDYEDEEDEDEDDDEGGFFLKVRSPSSASLHASSLPGFTMPLVPSKDEGTQGLNDLNDDAHSMSSTASKYRTIQLLPSTTLNHGSSDEESDDENPYTSSLSHNVNNNSSRGYDYHYDYNTVYTVDPNHSIYGSKAPNQETPDVVDVPENITLGSNFDYKDIENEEFRGKDGGEYHSSMPIIDPVLITNNNVNYGNDQLQLQHQVGDFSSSLPKNKKSPFDFNDSDSDSDSDSDEGGLSIGTRTSSHSLAQSVFGSGNIPAAAPVYEPMSVPTGGSAGSGFFKQPSSSNSLSSQFFGSGMTKQKGSSSALSEQFFNAKKDTAKEKQQSPPQHHTPAPTQRKASPLPPHITSANAFSGNITPPPPTHNNEGGTFLFDSDSESEDEFIEDTSNYDRNSPSNNTPSYTTLSQVAGENGIRSPSPDVSGELGTSSAPVNINPTNSNNLVGQAKGFANQLLGSWKGTERDSSPKQ